MTAGDEPALRLRKPLERALREGHPWVYRDALQPADAGVAPGLVARVLDQKGRFLARGITDAGPIALRVFTLRDESVGPSLFASRVARADELRARVLPAETDAYRLLNGEGDRLPGFVCDVYGPFAVLKTDGAGALAFESIALDALRGVLAVRGVDAVLRRSSGRTSGAHAPGEPKAQRAYGTREVPPRLTVREHGMALQVDLLHGQKTGLFLDQRESRARVRSLARDLRVLNLYAYTGGFSVAAGLGGARSVVSVDVAKAAISLAEETWAANSLSPELHRGVCADVPAFLAERARDRARYDLIVADPPSFAPSEDARDAALASYAQLHAACLGLLAPGGYYLAGSCSSHIDMPAFAETVREGARRAKRVLQSLDAWGAPADHPRLAAFSEGDYLKVRLYRAD